MKKIKTAKKIICDVCNKTYDCEKNWDEVQEFHYINFKCGYSSIFGDDNVVSSDICQHCLKEKLGDYLSIKC